jgi:hypothetical protein
MRMMKLVSVSGLDLRVNPAAVVSLFRDVGVEDEYSGGICVMLSDLQEDVLCPMVVSGTLEGVEKEWEDAYHHRDDLRSDAPETLAAYLRAVLVREGIAKREDILTDSQLLEMLQDHLYGLLSGES